MKKYLFGWLLVLLALFAFTAPARAQYGRTVVTNTLVSPFAAAINAGSMSNLLYLGVGTVTAGLNVSGTNIVKLQNAPLGIDLFFSSTTTTTAVNAQIAIAIQTSTDGGTTFSQAPLYMIVPAGIGITNISFRTNFTQAMLGNANAIRIGQITNNNATAITLSPNGLKVGYFY